MWSEIEANIPCTVLAVAVRLVVISVVIAACHVVMTVVIAWWLYLWLLRGGYTSPVVLYSAVCWAYDRATQVQLGYVCRYCSMPGGYASGYCSMPGGYVCGYLQYAWWLYLWLLQ